MKSKKIRKVILKTPWARRLRLNLRIVLNLTIRQELIRLSNLDMRREWRVLERQYNKSILQCGMPPHLCESYQELKKRGIDLQDRPILHDLVWVPWLEDWFCFSCYIVNRFSEMTHADFDDPVAREWVKKEFGI